MCQYNKRYGRHIQADTVHHIYPAEQYPEYEYCEWNLISLSSEAHNIMHDRNNNCLTDEGLRLMKRVEKNISEKIFLSPPSSSENFD